MKPISIDKTELMKTISWLTLFSIAMGFLETAVVVYMRKLYYPDGFKFPLVPISPDIAATEFSREAATLIMLLGVGILAGKNAPQRFVFFLYAFAIWDIFYYVFLYVILGWPSSLFTWDILFIIPVPWIGPVICPCLVSLTMIALTISTIHWQLKGKSGKLSKFEKLIFVGGCFVVIVSFVWDYLMFAANHSGKSSFSLSHNKELFSEGAGYVPQEFSWLMFWCGEIMLIGGVVLFSLRMKAAAHVQFQQQRPSMSEQMQNEKLVLETE